jgi:hypothetical protein
MDFKKQVLLIAPELKDLIYGQKQITKVLIQDLEDFEIRINEVLYIATVDLETTIEDIITDLTTQLTNDLDSPVNVLNILSNSFELISKESESFEVSELTTEQIREAISPDLFELFLEDIEVVVNTETFLNEIETAKRYLIAHYLTVHQRMGSEVTGLSSVKVGDISYSNANPFTDLASTKYGLIFSDIKNRNKRITFPTCKGRFN